MAFRPIFCVARLSMVVAQRLEIGQIADGGMSPTEETMY
jgi:hypothetical protein